MSILLIQDKLRVWSHERFIACVNKMMQMLKSKLET